MPWPPLRQTWWILVIASVVLTVFASTFALRLACVADRCGGSSSSRPSSSIDGLNSVPRLLIVGLLLLATTLACAAAVRTLSPARVWWLAVTAINLGLAIAKVTSVHSIAKSVAPASTLGLGTLGTAVALLLLLCTGERSGVKAARPVVAGLGLYAVATLGLDAVASGAELFDGPFGYLAAAFLEELGEALTALILVVILRWNLPSSADAGS